MLHAIWCLCWYHLCMSFKNIGKPHNLSAFQRVFFGNSPRTPLWNFGKSMTLAKNKPSRGTSDTKKAPISWDDEPQICTIDFKWKNLPKGDKNCWLVIIGFTDHYQSIGQLVFGELLEKPTLGVQKFNLAAHRSTVIGWTIPSVWKMVGAAAITLGLCAAKSRSMILKKRVRKLDFVEFLGRHHQRRTVKVLT